ncbi:MAG: phosphotransferase [Elusimicrobiota bacterium]
MTRSIGKRLRTAWALLIGGMAFCCPRASAQAKAGPAVVPIRANAILSAPAPLAANPGFVLAPVLAAPSLDATAPIAVPAALAPAAPAAIEGAAIADPTPWFTSDLADYIYRSRHGGAAEGAAGRLLEPALQQLKDGVVWDAETPDEGLPGILQRALALPAPPRIERTKSEIGTGANPVFRVFAEDGTVLAYAKILVKKADAHALNELTASAVLRGLAKAAPSEFPQAAETLGTYRLDEASVLHLTAPQSGSGLAEDMEKLRGTSGEDRENRLRALERKAGAVGQALAEIHGRSPRGPVNGQEKGLFAGYLRGLIDRLERERPETGARRIAAMRRWADAALARFAAEEQLGTYAHGDANLYNFRVKDDFKVGFIDYGTLFYSIGEDGRGNRSPAADLGRYVEMLSMDDHGLRPRETKRLQDAFLSAYAARARGYGISMENLSDALELYRFYNRLMGSILISPRVRLSVPSARPAP